MASDSSLADKVVLVTRPQHQQAEFIQLLNNRAATALSFPTIEIQAAPLTTQLTDKLNNLSQYDLIIFVSANAVSYALNQLKALSIAIDSITPAIAVIGSATSKIAQDMGLKINYQPESGYNTEALLELPVMQKDQVSAKRMLIIRGVGGREHLADELQERGATVEYAEVYRRRIPEKDGPISRSQLSERWTEFNVNVITVTSNEALHNLYDMLESPGKEAMLKTDLIVPSVRCYELAKSIGFVAVTISESAVNQQMIESIINLSHGK